MKFADFAQLAKGFDARHKVDLPMLGGQTVAVDVVALPTYEIVNIEADAYKFAEKKGVAQPKPGVPIYDRALHMHTILRACMDHDVHDKQEPFFENLDQIGKCLDPDRVQYLFHHQRAWQESISPLSYGDVTPDKFIEMAASLAYGGEADFAIPFDNSPRGMQLSFLRQLARAYFGLLSHRSMSGSLSQDEEKSSPSSSESARPDAPPPLPTPPPASPDEPAP